MDFLPVCKTLYSQPVYDFLFVVRAYIRYGQHAGQCQARAHHHEHTQFISQCHFVMHPVFATVPF